MKTVEYEIVRGGIFEVSRIVNELVKAGWEPIGGLCALVEPGDAPFFYQAMVRKEPPESLIPTR